MATTAEALEIALTHHRAGRLREAEAIYRQIVQADPDRAETLNNLGAILQQQGQLVEAGACFRRAITIRPEIAELHHNLGLALYEQFQLPGAAAAITEALRLKPNYPEAWVALGKVKQRAESWDEALQCFQRAISLNPNYGVAHLLRANMFALRKMVPEAQAGYLEALRVAPSYVEAYHNLAVLFVEARQPDRVVEYCQKAFDSTLESAELYCDLAIGLQLQGRIGDAIAGYRKSVALRPESASFHSNLLYYLNFDPAVDPATLFTEHLAWAVRHAEMLTAQAPLHANDRTGDRRLRIGYVSPHFRSHAVAYFTEPLLVSHDHAQFEIFCYCDNADADDVTTRLKASVDHWRAVKARSDDELAALIRGDEIDILVDLTGHIGGNRLLVFARQAAPVQVTYLGYQNTTGMSAMDYRLTDERADPPGLTDPYYTEQLVRLPRSFFCYRPPDVAPAVTPLPALSAGHVTFGSFNNYVKVTPQVIATWLKLLDRVPQSRLLVLAYTGGWVERNLRALAQEQGIDPDRIELFNKRPLREYLELIQQADVGLDPFPFNGHTTTCDSIWMGVPVVMLEGSTYASRFGGSVLANVGLEHLIARTPEEYIEIAANLAGDLDRLAHLRSELRPRMADSVLLDFQGFTRNLEAAYRQMWHTWCERPAGT